MERFRIFDILQRQHRQRLPSSAYRQLAPAPTLPLNKTTTAFFFSPASTTISSSHYVLFFETVLNLFQITAERSRPLCISCRCYIRLSLLVFSLLQDVFLYFFLYCFYFRFLKQEGTQRRASSMIRLKRK